MANGRSIHGKDARRKRASGGKGGGGGVGERKQEQDVDLTYLLDYIRVSFLPLKLRLEIVIPTRKYDL